MTRVAPETTQALVYVTEINYKAIAKGGNDMNGKYQSKFIIVMRNKKCHPYHLIIYSILYKTPTVTLLIGDSYEY